MNVARKRTYMNAMRTVNLDGAPRIDECIKKSDPDDDDTSKHDDDKHDDDLDEDEENDSGAGSDEGEDHTPQDDQVLSYSVKLIYHLCNYSNLLKYK